MNVAIDIDGTLSVWFSVLGPLSKALTVAGHTVVLLTGHSCPDPENADRDNLLHGRRTQVEPFCASFQEIIVCVGRNSTEVAQQKAEYCRNQQIDLFIDDSLNYCAGVRQRSPGTLVLHVQP